MLWLLQIISSRAFVPVTISVTAIEPAVPVHVPSNCWALSRVASGGRVGLAASAGAALALGCVVVTGPTGAGDGNAGTVFAVAAFFFSSSIFFCSSSQRVTAV